MQLLQFLWHLNRTFDVLSLHLFFKNALLALLSSEKYERGSFVPWLEIPALKWLVKQSSVKNFFSYADWVANESYSCIFNSR